ncbi:MAG: hypothetical protein PUE01_12775 [Clostridiaceae bacterium]|nr:hypothetical protein [Clostridiaceae bacterium]
MLENFKIAVENNNMEEARGILTKMVYNDECTPSEFKEAIDLGSEYNLFEEYNDKKFLLDPRGCDESNLNNLKDILEENFSKEVLSRIYYINKYMKSITETNEESLNCGSNESYKDFSFYTKLCAAASVVTAGAIIAGVWALSRKRKK